MWTTHNTRLSPNATEHSDAQLFSDTEGNVASDLSLNKSLMKGDSERVDMPVDNEHGLINFTLL
jgi:hypothetical protein